MARKHADVLITIQGKYSPTRTGLQESNPVSVGEYFPPIFCCTHRDQHRLSRWTVVPFSYENGFPPFNTNHSNLRWFAFQVRSNI